MPEQKQSPSLLALDTSTEACSVALLYEGQYYEDFRIIPRRHGDEILGMVQTLLGQAGMNLGALDAIACGCGPGSFTGIRIATAITQGLAFGQDLPVIAVSGLQALAWQSWQKHGAGNVIACLDARINEVYWACVCIDDGRVKPVGEEHLSIPEQLVLDDTLVDSSDWHAAGNGWCFMDRVPERTRRLVKAVDEELLPSARGVLAVGEQSYARGSTIRAAALRPTYLRDDVARKPGPL